MRAYRLSLHTFGQLYSSFIFAAVSMTLSLNWASWRDSRDKGIDLHGNQRGYFSSVFVTLLCWKRIWSFKAIEKRPLLGQGRCLGRESNRGGEQTLRLKLLCLSDRGTGVDEGLYKTEFDCNGNLGAWGKTGRGGGGRKSNNSKNSESH